MPGFAIVDSHVHLYDPRALPYGWMKGIARLDRRHDLAELDAARGAVEVERLVFVEVWVDDGRQAEEVAWVVERAGRDPRLQAIVAQVRLERGQAAFAELEALAAQELVKGVRRLIQGERPGFCLQPAFVEGVRRCGRLGLAFDVCVKHEQMAEAIELVRRCPEVRFVLDHIGKPGIAAGLREPWWSQIEEMARLPNVWCKISGVITEADHAAWTPEQVRPYVDRAMEVFGFDRIMFGGDWPVSEQTHRYSEWVAIVEDCAAGCSPDELRHLFRDNAIALYRLPERI